MDQVVDFKYLKFESAAIDTEGELTSAIANVAENGAITMGGNITLTGTLTITGDKSFNIDLNGCTLSYFGTVIDYKGTGMLTITDSSSTGGGTVMRTRSDP